MSTVALNIIVGPGEVELLSRCIESFKAESNFDEIVIVNTSEDHAIDEYACSLKKTKLVRHQWASPEFPFGNFALARNAAIDATESDFIMYLDTDDVLLDKFDDKLIEMLRRVREDKQGVDIFLVPYAIVIDQDGNSITSFMKDRIFRKSPIMRWRFAVHEQIRPRDRNIVFAKVSNIEITHLPMKPSLSSADRNVKILQIEYDKIEFKDPEIKYFLARDCMLSGRHEQGVKLLEEMIQDIDGSYDSLYAVCMDLAQFYAYGGITPRPALGQIKPESYNKVMKYCRLALAMTTFYAEPFVILGDVYHETGNKSGAEKLYSAALTKSVGSGNLQSATYYEEIPCDRLCNMNAELGKLEKALWFCSRAVKCLPIYGGYVDKYNSLLEHLTNRFQKRYKNVSKN